MAESPIQSSFIPRDTATVSVVSKYRSTGLYDLLMLVGIVLFVASSVLAVGVFLYQQYLQTESTSKSAQLGSMKEEFKSNLIQEMTRLDDRMTSADQLLSAHLAPTVFFGVLEKETLQSIVYTSMDLQSADSKSMTLKLGGIAGSINSVALQAELFSKSALIVNPIFSGINRQNDGVHFVVAADVNPALLKYSQFLNQQTSGGSDLSNTQSNTAQPVSPFEKAPQGGAKVPTSQ